MTDKELLDSLRELAARTGDPMIKRVLVAVGVRLSRYAKFAEGLRRRREMATGAELGFLVVYCAELPEEG